MKSVKTYIFTTLVVLIAFIELNAQNEITIHSKQDSTVIGWDAVFDITIDPSKDINTFNIAVLDAPGIQKIYKNKYNFSKIDSSEQNIVDFEISDFGKWKGVDNKITIDKTQKNNQIKLKIWDPGAYMILPFVVKHTDELTDTIYPDKLDQYPSILVFPTVNPKDTIRDFTPIKGLIIEKENWRDYLLYIYIALGIILLTLAAFLLPKLFKKEKTKTSEPKHEIVLPAHTIALKKLKKIEEEKAWKEESRIKEYQSKLTHVLREYLENRFSIKALEQTTDEIADSLSKLSISEKDTNTIKNILQIADLVKFAKAKPGEDIHKKFLVDTIDFVNKTIPQQVE